MKRALFFIGAFLLFAGCKKMDCCLIPNSAKTFMTAQKDGNAWSAVIDSASMTNDTLTVTGDIPNSYLHSGPWPETIRLSVKYNGPGDYQLTKSQVLYVTQFGPDLVPFYMLNIDSTFNNSLIITAYDPLNNVVSGTFNLKFINNSNPVAISYITFSGGKFTVPLHK